MTVQRIISSGWLSASATQSVFAAIEAGGFQARAVGGIVRNTLLGGSATDIDIATTSEPGDTIALAKAAGLKTFETGLAHGTVTVVAEGVPFEVTTLRRDVTTDGRHAQVVFTNDWAADASRRDFTINALYCGRHGHIFDPLGGMADLDPVRIRFIGDAKLRITEDLLRILRFFRFTAEYCADGVMDAEGLAACEALRHGLARISGERIQSEILKLFVAKHAVPVTKVLTDTGVYSSLFDPSPRFEAFARLAAIEAALGRFADGPLRFAALSVSTGADALSLNRRLRLSVAHRARLETVAADRGEIAAAMDDAAAKKAMYRLGPARYSDAVLVAWADSGRGTGDADFRRLLSLAERWAMPQFPLKGADALNIGVKPGPAVGTLLKRVEADWVEDGFKCGREKLLEQLALLARDLPP